MSWGSDSAISCLRNEKTVMQLRSSGVRTFSCKNDKTGESMSFGLDPIYQCGQCSKVCASENALLAHERNHQGRFICISCTQEFASESALSVHKTIHDGIMAGAVVGGGVTGAKIGALFGPVGIAIGASAGVGVGLLTGFVQKKT